MKRYKSGKKYVSFLSFLTAGWVMLVLTVTIAKTLLGRPSGLDGPELAAVTQDAGEYERSEFPPIKELAQADDLRLRLMTIDQTIIGNDGLLDSAPMTSSLGGSFAISLEDAKCATLMPQDVPEPGMLSVLMAGGLVLLRRPKNRKFSKVS